MIVQEHFTVNGRDFVQTKSTDFRYVVRDGISYSEACDPAEFNRQYIEGDFMGNANTEESALVRYANELTGNEDETLTEATETLIKQLKEGN